MNAKSRNNSRLTDEHLKGCKGIATTEIKPGIEILLKQNQIKIKISLMADFVKEN
jgi:hypothetical protein